MSELDPRVLAHLAASEGLITTRRARDLGLTMLDIIALVRAGTWVWVRRGVYADAAVWNGLDDWRGKPLWRAKGAILTMQRGWVLSHDSAAHAHGLPMLRPPEPRVHITRPGFTNAWVKADVSHHLARFTAEQVVDIDGYPTLDIARTVADVARQHGRRYGLVVADAALRRGITKQALWEAIAPMTSWPYITQCRAAIELADPRAESPAETLARELVIELGLGDPDPQFPIRLPGGRIVWADLRLGRHIIEAHGKVKVQPPEHGGVAARPPEDVLWDARKRERLIAAEGFGISNLYWEDFFGDAREAAKRRLRAEIRVTRERLGDVLPEQLARSAAEIRAHDDRSGDAA